MRLYYSHDPNPRVAVAVARYLAAPVVFVQANPRYLRNERSAAALGGDEPSAPVPMLVEESRTLWETDAIACRLAMLAKSDLWPTDACAPELQTWLSWGRGLTRAANALHRESQLQETSSGECDARAAPELPTTTFHRFAAVLDDVLARRTWLIDNRLTYADFRVATALPFAISARLPVGGYPHILKWHERLCRLSAWARPWPDAEGRETLPPRASAGGGPRREAVAVSDAVVDAADELAVARQVDELEWLQARDVRTDPLGGELLGRPGHKH
jgi:glutathione S-transferase